MTKLSADINKLDQAKKDLTKTRSELTELKGKFEKYRSVVNDEWEGAAAEAFKAKLDRYIYDIQCFMNTIDELNTYTGTTADYMRRLDEESKKISQCFETVNS